MKLDPKQAVRLILVLADGALHEPHGQALNLGALAIEALERARDAKLCACSGPCDHSVAALKAQGAYWRARSDPGPIQGVPR